MPKLTTSEILTRLRSKIEIYEAADPIKVKYHQESINEFVKDCKELIEYLAKFKKTAKDLVPIKEAELQYYKKFTEFLTKYEETNMKYSKNDGSII